MSFNGVKIEGLGGRKRGRQKAHGAERKEQRADDRGQS